MELAALQVSPSSWHTRRARIILQSRAATKRVAAAAHDVLRRVLETSDNGDHRLNALWTLHATKGIAAKELLTLLEDKDQHIRAWAIQLLCEDHTPSVAACSRFATLAKTDPSPIVRLYLAASMQRMSHEAAWPIAEQLTLHAEDADDHNLPKMIWFAIEPMVVAHPSRALRMASVTKMPMITRYVARRLADENRLEEVVAAIDVQQPAHHQLLLGLRDGVEGRKNLKPPSSWMVAYEQLQTTSGPSARVALQLAQQFGDTMAADKMLVTVGDRTASIAIRQQAIRFLAAQRHPKLESLVPGLLDDEQFRREAIRAAVSFDSPQLGKAMLEHYDGFSAEDKLETVHTMATRSGYGRALTKAISRGDVPRRDIPAYIVRTLRRVVGNSFVDVWGPIDELAPDKEAAFTKFRALLTNDALRKADACHGRVIFIRACIACHKLHGEGGAIGPDITGANRPNLEYLLGNILTPSAVIQDAYKMHLILTDDGRVYSGIPAGENERQLRLRIANRLEPIVIAKSQIESREIAPVSMMPEGLLKNLADAEVLDLIAYLRMRKQVPLPTEQR